MMEFNFNVNVSLGLPNIIKDKLNDIHDYVWQEDEDE